MKLIRQLIPSISLNQRKNIELWWQGIMFLISLLTIVAVIIDYGFVLNKSEMSLIHRLYRTTWWFYFISYTLNLLLNFRNIKRKAIFMTIITGIALYLSAIPYFFDAPQAGWAASLWEWLSDKLFLMSILILLSILEVSKGVTTFINRSTNPAIVMIISFATIIMLGSLLLMLPRSTLEHIRLPLIDAIFISTSAVCVTGLSSVDVAQTFTLEGQIIILLLIQIGGLGVMTLTSFFALFFMGGSNLFNQFTLRDMVGGKTLDSLISTLLYILTFTIVIECVGAFFIWLTIHGTMGMTIQEEIFFSVFHSISAFCNAGFSTLTGNLGNEVVITGHNSFYLVISMLIVLGGIGFPLLVNFKHIITYHIQRLWMKIRNKRTQQERFVHLTNINTKIVLNITALLILLGSLAIGALEWENAFAHMPVADKITHSIFNAIAPRTAGFNSVDLANFSILTVIIYIILMWIGGASQSTAGGIKINTFAVALANLKAVVKGRECVTLFNREISPDSIRRALATIFGSIIAIMSVFIALVILEPNLSARALFFETVSAYSTVGSSLNITALLGNESKALITILMFIGRIGFITIITGFIRKRSASRIRYPKDDVIIN